MFILVTGGAASGKSAYAEGLLADWRGPKYYIATMQVGDGESAQRVARHRAVRAGKGFLTLERPLNLACLRLPQRGAGVLLECLSNLAANERFAPQGAGEGARAAILAGFDTMLSQAELVVAVTNEVFSDGVDYDPATLDYLDLLGGLNAALAARADRVVEVVCGLPILQKGEALP